MNLNELIITFQHNNNRVVWMTWLLMSLGNLALKFKSSTEREHDGFFIAFFTYILAV